MLDLMKSRVVEGIHVEAGGGEAALGVNRGAATSKSLRSLDVTVGGDVNKSALSPRGLPTTSSSSTAPTETSASASASRRRKGLLVEYRGSSSVSWDDLPEEIALSMRQLSELWNKVVLLVPGAVVVDVSAAERCGLHQLCIQFIRLAIVASEFVSDPVGQLLHDACKCCALSFLRAGADTWSEDNAASSHIQYLTEIFTCIASSSSSSSTASLPPSASASTGAGVAGPISELVWDLLVQVSLMSSVNVVFSLLDSLCETDRHQMLLGSLFSLCATSWSASCSDRETSRLLLSWAQQRYQSVH